MRANVETDIRLNVGNGAKADIGAKRVVRRVDRVTLVLFFDTPLRLLPAAIQDERLTGSTAHPEKD